MPARRVNPYRVKLHRDYALQELAECLGVHKNTVRRWQDDGLNAIDGKPWPSSASWTTNGPCALASL